MAKVLIATQSFSIGGLETNIFAYCKLLKNNGHDVFMVTSINADLSLIKDTLNGHLLIDNWVPTTGENVLKVSNAIRSFITSNQIDFAHLHPYEGLLPAGLAVVSSGIRFVITVHSPLNFSSIYGFMYRYYLSSFLFPSASKVYAVSSETKAVITNITGSRNVKVIPNPVDTDYFKPQEQYDQSMFVLISRLDEDKKKGIEDVLNFLHYFNRKNGLSNQLIIVGDGNAKSELEDYTRKLGLTSVVNFIGRSNDVFVYLKKAKVVFGMGRVILEAGSMNKPVVLCGYDGLKGFVEKGNIDVFAEHNFSGRNSKNLSFDEIIEAYNVLAEIPEHFELREWIISNASVEVIGKRYLEDLSSSRANENVSWVSAILSICEENPNLDLFSIAGLSKWVEKIDLNVPSEVKNVLLISTEVSRLMLENSQLLQEIGMLNQHLHDINVYKADYEKSLKDQIYQLKDQNQLLGNQAIDYHEQIKQLTTIVNDNQSLYKINLENQQRAYEKLFESYAEINNKLETLSDPITQNHQAYQIIYEEKRELEQINNQLLIELNELRHSLNLLQEDNKKFEYTKRALSSKIYELSQSKYAKILNLMKRFNHQFMRGNLAGKKEFYKWFVKKIKKESTLGEPVFNPFYELWKVLEQPYSDELTGIQPETESESDFNSEYWKRKIYYQNYLKHHIDDDSTHLIGSILKRKYKGIIVYPEAVPWEPLQRPQQFLREFASMGYLCFFCTPSKTTRFEINEVESNLFVISKEECLLPVLRNHYVVVLCSWLIQTSWSDQLPHKYLWYDVLDQLEFLSLYDGNMRKKHEQMLVEADLVSYSAEKLSEYVRLAISPVYLPNAVKIEDFLESTNNIPNEMVSIIKKGNPIIGYFGAIEKWFDLNLIIGLAERNTNWEFVLIGKKGDVIFDNLPNNVHYIGMKPYKELYSYSRHFSVGVIPFVVNDLTNCVSPVKFFEYQAAGIPVVSTAIAEMLQYQNEYVLIGNTVDDFERSIKTLLNKNTEDIKRISIDLALQNQWKQRVAHVEKIFKSSHKGWTIYSNLDVNNCVTVMAASFLGFKGNNFYSGGAERYLIDLYEVCQDMNLNLKIFQYGDFPWVRRFKGIEVISISRDNHNTSVFSIENIKKFNQFFYEQIIGRSSLNIYSAFFEAWPKSAKPSIGISHGVAWDNPASMYETGAHFWEMNRRFIDGAKVCDQLVSVDTNTANWLQTIDYNIGKNVKVVPNYVDVNEFVPRDSYLTEREKVVIVYPRRLYEARGLYIVLEIMDELLQNYPNVHFHFVGKGFKEDTDHVVKKQEQWPDRVKWYWLDPDDMPKAYLDSDITLVPTLYSEGTSLSCLEAMASGNAVIATRIGGLTDLIINDYNGLLIEPNALSLKNAIIDLLENKHKLRKLKQRAVEVIEGFTKDRWKNQWKSIISSHLENPPQQTVQSRLIEIYLEKIELSSPITRLITELLISGNILYLYIKNSDVKDVDSFGRLQWIPWGSEKLSHSDVVIAQKSLAYEIHEKIDYELSYDEINDDKKISEILQQLGSLNE